MVNLAGAIEGPPIFKPIEEPVLAKFKDKLDTPDNFKKSYDAAINFLDKAIVDDKAQVAATTKPSRDPLLSEIETTALWIKSAKDLSKTPKPPEEGTYDIDSGKWTYKDASGGLHEGYESDLYPDMIQALDQISDPNAKTASDNFKKQLGVYVGRGQQVPITYSEWWQKVDTEAKKSAVDPLKPTQIELGAASKKLQKDEQVSFYVVYPKGTEKLEVENDPAERLKTAEEAGKMVINRIIEEAKGKTGVEADYSFGALTEFYLLLREAEANLPSGKARPEQVHLLTSLVSSAASTCMRNRSELFQDSASQDFVARLDKNLNFFKNPQADPVRGLVNDQLKIYAKQSGLDLNSLTENFYPHELVAYAVSLRGIEGNPNFILRNLSRLPNGAISSDSKTILETLVNSGQINNFRQAMLDTLGINPGFIESRLQSLGIGEKDITSGIEAFLKSKSDSDYTDAEIPLLTPDHKIGLHNLIHYDNKYLAGQYETKGIAELGKDLLQNNYDKALIFSLLMMLLQQGMDEGLEKPRGEPGE